MSYAKAVEKYETETAPAEDSCQHPGCKNRWTTSCNGRFCRLHIPRETAVTPPPQGWAAEVKSRLRRVT